LGDFQVLLTVVDAQEQRSGARIQTAKIRTDTSVRVVGFIMSYRRKAGLGVLGMDGIGETLGPGGE
jgi:hypothetical protein